jgi:hypothetical protein
MKPGDTKQLWSQTQFRFLVKKTRCFIFTATSKKRPGVLSRWLMFWVLGPFTEKRPELDANIT